MLTKSRVIISLSAIVAVAIAVALALVFTMSPRAISAQEILENAQEANTVVKTYRFTMNAWQPPQVEGDPARYETFTNATVVFNQGMHVMMTGNGEYSETLLRDGRQYERDSADGTWQEQPNRFDSAQMLTLDSLQIVDGLIGSTVVGKETLRGIEMRKVTGRLNLAQRAEDIWGNPDEQDADLQAGTRDPRLQMLAGTEEFTGWVGIQDGLIHAYEVSGSYPAEGELLAFEFWYRVDFTNFNQPLTLPSVR